MLGGQNLGCLRVAGFATVAARGRVWNRANTVMILTAAVAGFACMGDGVTAAECVGVHAGNTADVGMHLISVADGAVAGPFGIFNGSLRGYVSIAFLAAAAAAEHGYAHEQRRKGKQQLYSLSSLHDSYLPEIFLLEIIMALDYGT
ncbi:MAG TPA: hypothetical protein DCO77_02610 [Nitrospiraceae bacterium]|nr:hypothetical protein [Nitrospiraceae bacterium]